MINRGMKSPADGSIVRYQTHSPALSRRALLLSVPILSRTKPVLRILRPCEFSWAVDTSPISRTRRVTLLDSSRPHPLSFNLVLSFGRCERSCCHPTIRLPCRVRTTSSQSFMRPLVTNGCTRNGVKLTILPQYRSTRHGGIMGRAVCEN